MLREVWHGWVRYSTVWYGMVQKCGVWLIVVWYGSEVGAVCGTVLPVRGRVMTVIVTEHLHNPPIPKIPIPAK